MTMKFFLAMCSILTLFLFWSLGERLFFCEEQQSGCKSMDLFSLQCPDNDDQKTWIHVHVSALKSLIEGVAAPAFSIVKKLQFESFASVFAITLLLLQIIQTLFVNAFSFRENPFSWRFKWMSWYALHETSPTK